MRGEETLDERDWLSVKASTPPTVPHWGDRVMVSKKDGSGGRQTDSGQVMGGCFTNTKQMHPQGNDSDMYQLHMDAGPDENTGIVLGWGIVYAAALVLSR